MVTIKVPGTSYKKIVIRKKSKENKALNETRTDADYGFIRGANYFGDMKICHLMGASGNGKTWISNAFRVQACRLF